MKLTGGRFVTLTRSDLSRLLFGKIENTAEVIFGDEIVEIEEQTDCARVRLKHGGERRFDLVIGADGLHSAVRRISFGPQQQFEKPLGYVVAAFEVGGYRPRDEDVYLMYGLPGRMLGRFTQHDDRTLFLFVLTAHGNCLPDTIASQKRLLREVYDDGKWECPRILDELDRNSELYFDRVSQIRMKGWSCGRIALVGDAAFCVSLVAGQGSALAMISAYVLAAELAKANGEHREAFYNYERRLRGYISKKQKGAARFASAFAPKTRWGLWFRNQVIGAFAIPGVARLAVGGDIIDTLRLPNYLWQCFPASHVSEANASSMPKSA